MTGNVPSDGQKKPVILWRLAAFSVLLTAFALRAKYLSLFFFHIDEFFTLEAAKLIADTGMPRYPVTGYFYDPGLPFSYLDGVLFRGLGFSEALGRFPALVFGVLAVATVIWLGKRVLSAPWVGVLAGLMLALDVDSVEWSGRARMITLAQWLALVVTALLWLGLTRRSTRHRVMGAVSAVLTLLTHFSTVVLLPAWMVAVGVLWRTKIIVPDRKIIRDGIILAALSSLALVSGAFFQPAPTIELQLSDAGLSVKIGTLLGKFLQFPPDFSHAWAVYGQYFFRVPQWPVLLLTLLGFLFVGYRAQNGRLSSSDKGSLYLTLIFVVVLIVLGLAINEHWQRSRYLLMQVLGIFYLLGGYGVKLVVQSVCQKSERLRRWQGTAGALLAVAILWPFVAPLRATMDVGYIGWNRYDLAAKFVTEKKHPDEKIMTMHPPATQLYIGQTDYYLVQNSPKLIMRADSILADRYTGAQWLETASDFDAVLAEHPHAWLVTQEFWLFNNYDSYLQQEILWKMDKLWGEGGVWALSSRPDRWMLAKEMAQSVGAVFDGGGILAGYTIEPDSPWRPGNTIRLTLFWQGDKLPVTQKVFVQLRDAENNTIAQADHFIYDGKVPSSRWAALWENDTAIRDGATLVLPPDLPAGEYHIFVGFYHPETFARVDVLGDESGEAAVVLGPFSVLP